MLFSDAIKRKIKIKKRKKKNKSEKLLFRFEVGFQRDGNREQNHSKIIFFFAPLHEWGRREENKKSIPNMETKQGFHIFMIVSFLLFYFIMGVIHKWWMEGRQERLSLERSSMSSLTDIIHERSLIYVLGHFMRWTC